MKKLLSWRWLALLALATLLAACNPPQASVLGPADTTPTADVTATPSPTPRPVNTLSGASYMCADPESTDPSYIHLGDVRVTAVQFALAYPSVLLPNTTAGKPYKLPANTQTLGGPPVNPNVMEPGGGYGFFICNTSKTASHTIQGVTVKIEQFAPYADKASMWQFCDGFYQRPTGAQYGGCGGAFPADEALHATFASDATTGASVTVLDSDTVDLPESSAPPLPISLGPGQQLIVNVGLTPPTAVGTYTFGFYLNFDNGQPVKISTMAPTLFDPAATKWTAQACMQATMLSQIPTSDTSGKYVCQEQ